jgi:predicted phage terminase large subunit-like protein
MNQVTDVYEHLKKLSRDELIAKARAASKLETRDVKKECEESLVNFIRHAWDVVEPGQPYVHGWHIDAIAMHLEATATGDINRLLINVPPGPMRDDNIVETARGFVPLKEILIGDKVLTHKGRYRTVEEVHQQGILPILRIETESGRVTYAAPSHPYLTPKGWIKAQDLCVGDILAVVNPIYADREESDITPEVARLLGYIVGDGSVTQAIPMFTNGDREIVDDFIFCCKSVGLECSESWRKTHWNVRVNGGKIARDFFAKYELMGKSSYEKTIPQKIKNSNKKIIQEFIGAYWSCDGMIEVRDTRSRGSIYRSNCSTVNKKLAEDLLQCLTMLGIDGYIRHKSRKIETAAQPGGIYNYYMIEIQKECFTALFANMEKLCSRKRILAEKCKRKFETVLWEDKIISVTTDEPANCMCITVEEDHSFVCNGIAVKNCMKSLATTVFFPAWLWGPRDQAHLRFLCVSHSQNLAVRDSTRMRRLVQSEWYKNLWGDRVVLTGDQNSKLKFETTKFGFREAAAAGSITGSRGDFVLCDDPHSVEGAASEAMRNSTKEWFLEAVPTRLNNPKKSVIVVIKQRLHEEDVSGIILERNLGYEHLMLPMEFDPNRKCVTSIGFEDPRSEDGELLFQKRFPRDVVERDKLVMGPYAAAGQLQQAPAPRGGGIIKREWWQLYDDAEAQAQGMAGAHKYPMMDYVVASLDPAYTIKQENDPSALTIWGVWQKGGQSARRILGRSGEVVDYLDDRDTIPCLMLMHAWAKRLPIHGPDTDRVDGETEFEYKQRQQFNWGLVEWIIDSCNKYNVDTLLIESKGSGISVAQEIQRLNRTLTWNVQLINPGNADKVARAYAVQPIFSNGIVYAPDKTWADEVITEAEVFPKGRHDDRVDSTTQALKFLRERNLLQRPEDILVRIKDEVAYKSITKPVYDV